MERTKVNLLEVGTKAQSKNELYRLLTVEGGMYLPLQEQTNMEFISDIAFGEKSALYSVDVKVCQVPHVGCLRVKDLIKFIIKDCQGEIFLPRNYLESTPNRGWLANICNTLNYEMFQQMIHDVLSLREDRLLKKKHMVIDIDPNFAFILKNSSMVSVTKGKSHHLLRKKLLRDEKEQANRIEKKQNDGLKAVDALQEEINNLKEELKQRDDELGKMENNQKILHTLYENGVIDEHGNLL